MMRSTFFWLLAFGGFAAVSLLCGILVWPQLSAAWPSIEEQIDRFRRQPPLIKLLLLLFVGAFVVYGSTKTNLVDCVSGEAESLPLQMVVERPLTNGLAEVRSCSSGKDSASPLSASPIAVAEEDIARGWQLVEVRTNSNISYTMPEGATLASNWWVRGAFEDCSIVRLGDCSIGGYVSQSNSLNNPNNQTMSFPFGTNEYDSVWAFAWGKLRFELGNTNTEIVAVGAPMSAVPYRSRLWSAANTNGSRFVTWENFVLGRAKSGEAESFPLQAGEGASSEAEGIPLLRLVNAQVELRSTGDFIVRSNDVEKVYRRVDPEDWDGDGWRNEDDPDPYVREEFHDYFEQELPEGANESAYYWVDVRPRWNSWIEFYGDAPSNLDDPYVYGKAGETYRVRLLIGKTYTIVGGQPVDVVGRSSSSIEIDGSGTSEIEVVWPVTFSAFEGNGSSFMMRVSPSWLGGAFSWTQHCCGLTGYGNQFWWAHEGCCYCGGCYASGWYSYEGYAKECVGGHCCCPRYGDDDPCGPQADDGPYAAGASVDFSESVVIFEDAYTNMPGEVVARQSTQMTLTCIAHGGETGGTVTFSIENGAKLVSCSGGSLPVTRFVPPQQKVEFEIVYEGKLPSGGERDIIARADFTERVTGTRHSTHRDWLTSVKVVLTPEDLPPMNPSPHRHLAGINEKVNLAATPASALVEWTLAQEELDGDASYFKCPWTGGVYIVSAQYDGAQLDTSITVVEPVVECREARWDEELDASAVVGESGWVGMRLSLYLLPRTVSFEWIEMEEIPVPSSQAIQPTGYFYLQPGVLHPTHDVDMGAGKWSSPRLSDGSWTGDKARMPYACPPFVIDDPPEWAQGTMRWAIPVGCGELVSDANGGVEHALRRVLDPNPTDQVYEMEADGTLTIRKYNHSIRRDVSGRVWLDGSRVNAWWN